MLRKRLVTVLAFNDGILFRTKLFRPDCRYTLNFVDSWSIDEVVVLDVTRPGQGDKQNFLNVIPTFTENCFVPLGVGGGVRTMEDVRQFLDLGAEKVIVNSGAFEDPSLISKISEVYGSQSVVVAIDARCHDDGSYEVFSHFASQPTGLAPDEWARQAEKRGAGEIIITSVERDGAMEGFDLQLCRSVVDAVTVPVSIIGGGGTWQHFVEGFTIGGASAVCTQNIYHFTDSSIKSAKTYLKNAGVDVRN